jgi:hypothetical protein
MWGLTFQEVLKVIEREDLLNTLSSHTTPGEWPDRVIQHSYLPPEILSEIFIHTGAFLDIISTWNTEYIRWKYQSPHSSFSHLIAILLVCKDWHDIARSTKELYQRQIRVGYNDLRMPVRFLRYLRYINPYWPLTIELGEWPAHEPTFRIFRRIFPLFVHQMVRFVDNEGEAMENDPFDDIQHAPKLEVLEVTRFTYPCDREMVPMPTPTSNFPALRLFICKTRHSYNTRCSKPGHRTHLLLVESPKLQELVYSKCYIAVDDWISQTKYSPNLKKLTLETVEWYQTPEQSSSDQTTLAREMVRYMSSLQTLALRGLETEIEPTSFEHAVLESMILLHGSLAHLMVLGLGANTPRINYPRCLVGVSNLTKVTLSFSSRLADERLSNFVIITANWLSTLPNLSDLVLEDDRVKTRAPADVTSLLDSLSSRQKDNLLINLSHLSLLKCSFDSGSLLSLYHAHSATPHGVLPPISRGSSIRVSLIGCRPYTTGGKKPKPHKSRATRGLDVRDADWETLRGALAAWNDRGSASMPSLASASGTSTSHLRANVSRIDP